MRTVSLGFGLALVLGAGCQRPAAPDAPVKALSAEERQVSAALNRDLSAVINAETIRYRALDYEYDEDLLTILDRIDAYLASGSGGPPPRAMPRLDAQEEVEHFRETFRRWRAGTGKDLRAELDRLKTEVAARGPKAPPFHPEFHKRFSAVFDDFIPLEVNEMRERRNRAIHAKARELLDARRESYPEIVRVQEEVLNQPPFNLTAAAPP